MLLGSPGRETVAELLRVVAVAGAVTVMAIVAVAPIGIAEVMEQEMVVVPLQDQPEEDVTETKVTFEGKVSERTFEVAGALSWPRF